MKQFSYWKPGGEVGIVNAPTPYESARIILKSYRSNDISLCWANNREYQYINLFTEETCKIFRLDLVN